MKKSRIRTTVFALEILLVAILSGSCRSLVDQQPVAVTTQPASSEPVVRTWPAEMELSDVIEKRLDDWDPNQSADQLPPQSICDSSIDVEGNWLAQSPFDATSMNIRRLDGDGYSIEFSTHGCLSRWKLQRTATYSDGVLKLNRPVRDYPASIYDHLYAVRVNDEECLLPSSNVHNLIKGLYDNGDPMIDPIAVEIFTLGRESKRSYP